MGTSSRYTWDPGRRIAQPLATIDPSSPQHDTEVWRRADDICKAMRDPRWRRDLTQPILESAAGATARACHTINDIIEGDRDWPTDDAQFAEFVSEVCDGYDGIHDAPVRRALVRTVEQLDIDVQARHARGSPLNDEWFCLFYQVFHNELLAELILHFVCEAALPGVSTVVLQTELGHWAAERVAKLLPNPCKETNPEGLPIPIRGARLATKAIGGLIEGPEMEVAA